MFGTDREAWLTVSLVQPDAQTSGVAASLEARFPALCGTVLAGDGALADLRRCGAADGVHFPRRRASRAALIAAKLEEGGAVLGGGAGQNQGKQEREEEET